MGIDMNLYMEKLNTTTENWEIVKRKNEYNYNFFTQQLKSKLSSIKQRLEVLYDDEEIVQIKKGIKFYENAPLWLKSPRDYSVFTTLANVGNFDDYGIKPYKFAGDLGTLPENISLELIELIDKIKVPSCFVSYDETDIENILPFLEDNFLTTNPFYPPQQKKEIRTYIINHLIKPFYEIKSEYNEPLRIIAVFQ
jgi:hypothetical protein